MRGLALARAQEDGSGVRSSDEPEERVDEIDPDSALHANNAGLFGCVLCVDVDLAENAEEGKPEDAVWCISTVMPGYLIMLTANSPENPVPGKCPVGLEEGNAVDEYGDG
jgi:hypothetical protein